MSEDYGYSEDDFTDFDQNDNGVIDTGSDTGAVGLNDMGQQQATGGGADTSQSIRAALEEIDRLMQYTRSKFGVGSGSAPAEDNAPAIDDGTGRDYMGNPPQQEDPAAAPMRAIGRYIAGPDQGEGASYSEAGPERPQYANEMSGSEEQPVAGPDMSNTGNLISRAGRAIGNFQDNYARPAIQAGNEAIASIPKRILSYLQGSGAMSVEEFNALKGQTGGTTDDERTPLAIAAAARAGGDDRGAAALQTNRQLYDHKLGFAKVALNGIEGKPGDIRAAANAATMAFSHLPDGTMARFEPVQGGVRVSVSSLGSRAPVQTSMLTLPQFNALLDVAGQGQFDRMYETGLPQAIQKIAQTPGTPLENQQAQRAPQARMSGGVQLTPMTPQQQSAAQQTIANNPWPTGRQAQQQRTGPQYPGDTTGFENMTVDQQANALFPSQGGAANRAKYIHDQMANKAKDTAAEKMERARLVDAGKTQRANQTDSRVREVNTQRIQQAIARLQQGAQTAQTRNLVSMLTSYLRNPLADEAKFTKEVGVSPHDLADRILQGGGQQAAPQQAPAQRQQPPVPGARQDKQGNWRAKDANGLWQLVR